MRTKVACLLSLALAFSFTLSLTAGEGKWTGWITDAKCGANGAKAEHKQCALKCAEGGQKLVLYNTADKKTYALDNQTLAKEHVGHEVTVHGKADAEGNIAVSKIEAAGH
ncbi:MAG: DUF5818 domain-containing protein [Acidobacteriota bacterium]